MKRCTHPAGALHWHEKDGVFICRRCGQIIFPTSVATPEDEFEEWDEACCWHCGGTGINIIGDPCEDCAGEGYLMDEIGDNT